jgi:hypothetical protein
VWKESNRINPKNIRQKDVDWTELTQTRIKYLDFHNMVMILLRSQDGGILLTISKTMNPTTVL